jgi:hypothetical protein
MCALYIASVSILLPVVVQAQGLEGRINDAVYRMITILNILLVGAIAWSGFQLAKGESSAVTRLLYTIVALIVVNSARLIIDYFL